MNKTTDNQNNIYIQGDNLSLKHEPKNLLENRQVAREVSKYNLKSMPGQKRLKGRIVSQGWK